MATVAPVGPQEVGAYEILSTLGQGGMATTYVAMRRGPGGFEQRVCLKRIRREHDQDPEFVRQFLTEARIAASVSHTNLVKVLDFGTDAEGYFLALELVPGMDLWGVFNALNARGERLAPELVSLIAVEVVTALEVLHRASPDGTHAGLIHRDVSPSNVLLSYDGEVKLADFGIARVVDGPKHTRTGIIKGKVPYMAPAYARTAVPDAQCDLFAVGVMLFELLAGQRPYQGQTDLLTLELAAKGQHTPLASLAPTAPPALVELAERLIQPNSDVRSATELLTALSALPPAGAAARRQLGQLIESLRPQRGSIFGLRAAPEAKPPVDGHTRTVPASAPMLLAGPADPTLLADTHAQPVAVSRWPLRLAAAAALAALIALSLLLVRTTSEATVPSNDTTATTEKPGATRREPTSASPVVLGVADPVDDTPAATPENAEQVAPAARATLHVSVIPYGEVIIDGKSRGQSPVTAKLNSGKHEITIVRPGARTTQRVTLSAGESRRILVE